MNYFVYTHRLQKASLNSSAGSVFNFAYVQPIYKPRSTAVKWEPEQCHKKKTNDPLNAKLVHFRRVSLAGGGIWKDEP